jgi:cell division transport system permease protein
LESNPLPWVLEVRPLVQEGQSLAGVVGVLTDWLEKQESVDAVIVDYKWLQRLAGLLALGNALVTVLSLLFAIAVLVIVANTIRLDVASRADEIEVLSVVGAGNGFIRLPFLYSGFWYGLAGGALALLLLQLSLAYLRGPLEVLLDAYGNTFSIAGPGIAQGLGVLIGGGVLGLLGAWISVARYLRALRRGGLLGRL